MPRTTTLECPGCPPIRALTFDVLGLVKVIEARSSQGGVPKVVERWGNPDSSKSVIAASIDDCKSNPLLAVARKNGLIEVISPLNGDICISTSNANGNGPQPEDSSITGLHLFKKHRLDSSSRLCRFLTCTTKGNASMRSIDLSKLPADSSQTDSLKTWNVSDAGHIFCSKVDGSENYALFGGKGVEINVWDLDQCTKIWNAKSPAKNSLGIFTPTWFTSATFLDKDDHRKFAAGTNNHQVRLYDISAQRRPVISFDFRESPIKAVAEDLDGHTIYIGNGLGDLASVDIRTGKLLGCFLGKCSGSIKSIVRHPEYPVIASCGLDSYLRFWDVTTRQLLSAVFLKQNLTNVVFDSHFCGDDVTSSAVDPREDGARDLNEIQDGDKDMLSPKRRKESQNKSGNEELKLKKRSKKDVSVIIDDARDFNEIQDGDGGMLPTKRKKDSKKARSKNLKKDRGVIIADA